MGGVALLGVAAGSYFYFCRGKGDAVPRGHAVAKVAPHPDSAHTVNMELQRRAGLRTKHTLFLFVPTDVLPIHLIFYRFVVFCLALHSLLNWRCSPLNSVACF